VLLLRQETEAASKEEINSLISCLISHGLQQELSMASTKERGAKKDKATNWKSGSIF